MSNGMFLMRSEREMYDLILGFARSDERVRGGILNGSRANTNAPRDKYNAENEEIIILRHAAPCKLRVPFPSKTP